MPSTHYTDLVGPPVSAAWLNEVDAAVYGTLPGVITGTVPISLAAGSVNSTALADGAVTAQKLGTGVVSAAKLALGAAVENIGVGGLTSLLYGTGSVTASALAPTAVTDSLGAGSITTTKLADLSVTTGKLDDGAVTSGKLASGAAVANIGTGGITATQLASGSITTAKFDAAAKAPFAGTADSATTATTATSATTATTANNALAIADGSVATSAKIVDAVVTPAKLAQPFTIGTAVASTSGTSVEFTGIPSWVKRITLHLSGVSTSGTNAVVARVGTSTQTYITGYSGSTGLIAATPTVTAYTSGLLLDSSGAAAASVRNGSVTFSKVDSNIWNISSIIALANTAAVHVGSSSITISGTLDRVRISTNSTDTFDAGTVNITYE